MKQKLVNILIGFLSFNVIAVIVFYGWVISNQLQRSRLIAHYPSEAVGGGGVSFQFTAHRQTQDGIEIPNYRPDQKPKEENLVFAGHTLKPIKKKHATVAQIPPVPEVSKGDDVMDLDESVVKTFLRYPDIPATETILILSPVHDVAKKLTTTFLPLLQSLNYPHKLISIAFGEDSSQDGTLHAADEIAVELRKSFASVSVFHFNLTGQIEGSWSNIHSMQNQMHRRKHLAQARNLLLRAALKNQTWALWIDSDITHLPPDIIQQLLSAEQDVVTPLCVYMDGRRKRVFDKNTWRETTQSRQYLDSLQSDALWVEGYSDTKRLWLSDLRAEGRVVPIDGVGGCTLLVRSKCHKDGLIFPEKVYKHHLETEGLAKMATDMGCGVYGMPFVEVVH